jgi:outer membrane receptor protein involved in Fe transport
MMIAFACRRGRSGVVRRLCLASMIGCALATTAWAQTPGEMHDYSVPAGTLAQSITAIGQSNGVQVIYDAALLQDKTTAPVSGHLSLSQALDKALAGSGLTYELVNSGHTLVIRRAPPPPQKNSSPSPSNAAASKKKVEPTTLDTIAVTGTRIRGGVTASPTITIGAQQIQDEGFSDLGEVIRSIPQNFNGGQNPGVVVGATAGVGGIANQNITGGSSLNLRGLGPDATLTLLNGRRLSYGGYVQAVDISAIPVEAVDRIEIVPDGASAIYGSDAVGGVGNVILKRDYEGAKVGMRYGGATDGGLATREYTATTGARWAGGGVLATFQDTSTDPIYARQRDYTDYMSDPNTLYPGSELRSGLVSAHQSIGESMEFRLDALRTTRSQEMYPWNTSLTPYYIHVNPDTKTSLVAPTLEIWLAGDWTLSMGGSWGRDKEIVRESIVDITSSASQTFVHDCYCNRELSWEVGAEGPLMAMPGGAVRLAVGAGYRRNEYVQHNLLVGTLTTQGEESSRFAYAELNMPLIGSVQGISGIQRLDLTAAVRGEDYSSFGRVATPKVGLIYGPNADFTLKASWGKSFKAPTLYQSYVAKVAALENESYYGGSTGEPNATVLEISGGNPNLKPERATTKSISLEFHPESIKGLEAELTWFDVDYTDRVVQPITDYSRAIGNPDYVQFISYAPTPQAVQNAIGSAAFYNFTGLPYDPTNVAAILYNQFVNVASQHAKGLDLSASNHFDLGTGSLTVQGSATWLDSTQQNSAIQPPYDVAGTLFNPAKVNVRAGAVWSQGGFSASVFVNYRSGVTDPVSGRKTATFTTFDTSLRYATGHSTGVLSGVEVALSAQNLLNRAPPFYMPLAPQNPPYDSTNYSAIGRFVSLSVSKRW